MRSERTVGRCEPMNEVAEFSGIQLLYEDNHLLVAVKPVNMPVQADESGDPDCLTVLKAYIKQKYSKPGAAYLGLVHRLDRPVGGVMVFARTTKAASRLSGQIRNRTMQKSYDVVVEGSPAEGLLENWVLRDGRMSYVVGSPDDSGRAKIAALKCSAVAQIKGLTLCRVELITGRHHQIRVQLSAAGTPVWGDARYGRGKPGEQIALWAGSLTLIHPTKGETMTFTARPSLYPFTLF